MKIQCTKEELVMLGITVYSEDEVSTVRVWPDLSMASKGETVAPKDYIFFNSDLLNKRAAQERS